MSLNITYGVSTWLWTSPFTTASAQELFPKISKMGFDVVEIAVLNHSFGYSFTIVWLLVFPLEEMVSKYFPGCSPVNLMPNVVARLPACVLTFFRFDQIALRDQWDCYR